MRSARVAEWILSLVTTPERAAATVGDLIENVDSRGRFWLGVLRTALSLLWSDVAADPGRMARLAGGAFLVGIALIFVCMLVIMPLVMTLKYGDPNMWASRVFNVPSVLAVVILVPFLQGRWLARRSPGHELAACLALTILTAAVDGITVALGMETISGLTLSIASPLIPMLAGVMWFRKKQTTH